jgi:hypothetical protein
VIDLKLIQQITNLLKPQFPGLYIGGQHENTPITLPAVLLDMKSDGVVGGPLHRGTLTVEVTSQADESNPSLHGDLVENVGAAIDALTGSTGYATIAGVVYNSSDSFRAERHFQTNLQFIIGYHEANSNC